MYNQDALFSTLVLDRFFRILSESKYLFSINADGSFVLSMIFFKMIEALKIREIDQMIESFQKDITRPEIVTPTKTATIKLQPTTPEMNGAVEKPKEQKEPLQAEITQIPKTDEGLEKFNQLILKIQDRNYDLAECFKNNISFVSLRDNTLTWESCADEECKKNT